MALTAPLDVVVVMDPIHTIKTTKDSTFAMLLEAARRGHRRHYVRPGGLAVRDGQAYAVVASLTATHANWTLLQMTLKMRLSDCFMARYRY